MNDRTRIWPAIAKCRPESAGRRRFIDAIHRCAATITLKDGSTAQCGRRKTHGNFCWQHAKAREIGPMMDRAIRECIRAGRADPRNPLVCVLPVAQLSREARDVPQRFRDRAIEHLAIRKDAAI